MVWDGMGWLWLGMAVWPDLGKWVGICLAVMQRRQPQSQKQSAGTRASPALLAVGGGRPSSGNVVWSNSCSAARTQGFLFLVLGPAPSHRGATQPKQPAMNPASQPARM
jgi:hypothetical protein